MANKKLTKIIIVALFVAGLTTWSLQSTEKCVNVYLDFGKLKNDQKIISCINVNGKTNALDILKQ